MNKINVNEGDVTIEWYLRSSHDPLKGKILSDVTRLSEEGLLAFTFTAILGDGSTMIVKDGRGYDEAVIRLTMSNEKFKKWEPLLRRLREMSFRWAKPKTVGDVIRVPFYGSNAIDLARAMIGVLPPILRDVLDILNFEKWERMRQTAEMEVKFRRGEMRVVIAGYGFTVVVRKSTVELEHRAKDDAEVDGVVSALRAVYGDGFAVNIRKSGRYRVVAIPMHIFERYDDIRAQVVEVLCRKYERTKDEEKRQIIAKHLKRLTAPTESAVAANCPRSSPKPSPS